MEQVKVVIPTFTPTKYEVKDRIYDNSGGGCMVGTLKVYIPELDRNVWVNCTDELVSVDAGDTVWDEEDDGSSDNAYDLNIYTVYLAKNEIPKDIEQWLPMIKEAIAYTVEQQIAAFANECAFTMNVVWLPDAIRERADPKYLESMREQGIEVGIGYNGNVVKNRGDWE